jgi:CRISPR-associated protein Csx10
MTDRSVLQVTVEAVQRLALGTGAEVSFFTATHPFVPGSVLRGALAAAWIAENGPPGPRNDRTSDFRALFDGRYRYGALHLVGSAIVPVSARLCKYPKRDAGCEWQAVDAAFETGIACPSCGGPTEQGKGQVLLPSGVVLDRLTRTSIAPGTAKAKDGELYAHGALPAGSTLTGVIHGRHPWLEYPRSLRLGGRRTVGGSAYFRAAPVVPSPSPELSPHSDRIVIRLSTPAIFTDVAGRPCLEPDSDLDLSGCRVQSPSWARPVKWQGWHAASRLPKPEELCAAAGSTYQVTGNGESLRRLAERLPREGIGLRRTEGFGAAEVVTLPWRPPPPAKSQHTAADDALTRRHAQVTELSLDQAERRWLIAALRELQLQGQRWPADPAGAAQLADLILARPAASDFSGRQRETLRDLFTEPDTKLLRDLNTLLLAEIPPEVPSPGALEAE